MFGRHSGQFRASASLAVGFVVAGSLAGFLYGLNVDGAANAKWRGLLIGGLTSFLIAIVETGIATWRDGALRRLPLWQALFVRWSGWVTAAVVGASVAIALIPTKSDVSPFTIVGEAIWISMLVGTILVTAVEAIRLLGGRALLHLATGRYWRPRTENRLVLILDVVGSTAIAERDGPEGFYRIMASLAARTESIVRARGGEIDRYIGDEIVATWPATGRDAAIAAVAELFDRLAAESVKFRVVLHAGPMVVGEMGVARREIVLLGDALNTSSRLLDLARELGEVCLVSEAVLAPPLSVMPAAHSLGRFILRGKKEEISVFALRPLLQ